MIIRHGNLQDLEAIVKIEQANFSMAEAASLEAMRERLCLIPDTFLVAEIDKQVVGYIEGPVIIEDYLTDDLFHSVTSNPSSGGMIAITSLSIDHAYQKQGIGKKLILAMKNLAIQTMRRGITLTCHDYLISYYEINGFKNFGRSQSNHGNSYWYDMIWYTPV